MEWLLWVLAGIAGLMCLLLVATFMWAAVMLCRIGRGDFGDLTDLGGHDGYVRPEPGAVARRPR